MFWYNATIFRLSQSKNSVCNPPKTWVFPNSICEKLHLGCPISLTHWGRVTHICVSTPTIIGSDNGLSPGRRQAIIWTNDGILLIEPLGTKFSEILIEIRTFSCKKMHLKMASTKWRPFCLGLNELKFNWMNGRQNARYEMWSIVPEFQKEVPRAGTSNYTPQIIWDLITCPCPWYLHLAQHRAELCCVQALLVERASCWT